MNTEIKWRRIPLINLSESSDCTVLALMTVRGITYQEAHNTLTKVGRGIGRGLRCDYLGDYLRENGFVMLEATNISLQLAANICREGRYLVRSKDHAFAIIDGVVYDCNEVNKKTKVMRIYKYVSI